MARPVNADADATRARILSSAVALFAERGIGGTSVRDVAADAGVSLAMVGHYFGTKDDLFDACIDAMYAELGAMKEELETALVSPAPLPHVFARAVARAFQFARKHRTAVRLLIRTAVASGQVHPRGQKLLVSALDLVSHALAARLDRPAGELRLPLQSLVFLVARYAAQDEAELAVVAGTAPRERRRAINAVEHHLVDVALGAFGLSAVRSSKKKGVS